MPDQNKFFQLLKNTNIQKQMNVGSWKNKSTNSTSSGVKCHQKPKRPYGAAICVHQQ